MRQTLTSPTTHSTASLYILLSAVGFGLNPMFVQLLASQGFDTLAITLYRFGCPAILCLPFLVTSRQLWPEAGRMVIFGISNGIAIYCYFNAIQNIPVGNAILIYYTYPVFCILIGWLFYQRRPCRNACLAGMLIFIAASLIITPESFAQQAIEDLAMCFLAPCLFAFQIQYLARPKQIMTAQQRMAWSSLGHLVILIPIAFIAPPSKLIAVNLIDFTYLFSMVVFAAIVPQLLFLVGVKNTPAERVATLSSIELIVAMLTGMWVMNSPLGQAELTAMMLICIALMIRRTATATQGTNTLLKPQRQGQ